MTAIATPVLVVDDLELLRSLVTMFLGELGYQAHSVENTATARQWLAENVPLLVVLDVMLPDGNGLDLCRWIRSQPRLAAVPVLIMTAIKDDETFMDAMEQGAMDYIKKPMDLETFKNKIDRLLGPKLPSL